MLSVGIVAALTLIGCVYLALTLRYFYRAPAIVHCHWTRLLRRGTGPVAALTRHQ